MRKRSAKRPIVISREELILLLSINQYMVSPVTVSVINEVALSNLRIFGFIQVQDDQTVAFQYKGVRYVLTDKGEFYLKHLCSTPLPVSHTTYSIPEVVDEDEEEA